MGLPVNVVIPAWGRYTATLARAVASAAGCRTTAVVDAPDADLARRSGADAVVVRPPGGTGPARNAGAATGTCPFVLFLDADDVLLPGAARLLLAALAYDPDPVMAYGRYRYSDGSRSWPERADARAMARPGALALLAERNTLPITASLIRRATMPADLFPDAVNEDWVAAVRLLRAGPVRYVDADVLLYSVYPGSTSRGPIPQAEQTRCEALVAAAAGLAPAAVLASWEYPTAC